MINHTVLMSGADYFANDAPINPYYDQGPIDVQKAVAEHQSIRAAFISAGIKVISADPPPNCQDGVYTANWALVRNQLAVMSRLPDARKDEELYSEAILSNLGFQTISVPEDWHFSGQGDSLPCGNLLLAGSNYRSDPRAQAFAAQTLGLELVQLETIPALDASGAPAINASSGWRDSFFYDIDLAISVITDRLIAYCPQAFTPASNAAIEALPIDKISVDLKEAQEGLACNLVSTGETVIMSNSAPKLRSALESRGIRILTPDVTELQRGGGYIRCVSLTLS